MPKKIKLNLSDLKVQSFVTNLNEKEKNELKGGASLPNDCYSYPNDCYTNDPTCVTCGPSICSGAVCC